MSPEVISPSELGERLRMARESAGITQFDAAQEISVARTTLVAIEQGQRRVRSDELKGLSKLYKTSVNTLLRRESVYVDVVPRFRKLGACSDIASATAAQLLADLVRAEVELENLLGVKRQRNFPLERHLLAGDVRIQAENDAMELRHRLGLGLRPVRDVIGLIEFELGVRVYLRPLDAKISGLFALDDGVGACMLLNANHSRERRNQTAVHEIGHGITNRHVAEVLHSDEYERSRDEKYANAFARAFLTPARTVMQSFHDVTAGSDQLTRRHVIILAHMFGVSREAMVRRLEELGLTKHGTWTWFESNGGISDEQARQVLGDLFDDDSDRVDAKRPTTLRLGLLASEAWRQGLLSEGQLSSLLHIDRVTLRGILDSVDIEEGNADGVPKLSR